MYYIKFSTFIPNLDVSFYLNIEIKNIFKEKLLEK